MSDQTATPTVTDARPIRLGYHGSTDVAYDIIRLAGWEKPAVPLIEYDINDPFLGIREGELDLMIIKFGIREPDLAYSRVLFEDARAVVVAADHPIASRDSVSIEDLVDYDAFVRPGNFPSYVWDEVVPPRTPSGRPIRRTHRVAAIPEMMRLVAEGVAVHISLLSLSDVAPPGIRVIPIHDLPPAPVTVAWRRGVLPGHVEQFITAAETEATR